MPRKRLNAAAERPLPFREPQQRERARDHETAQLDSRVPALLHVGHRELNAEEEKSDVTIQQECGGADPAGVRRLRRDDERSGAEHGAEFTA
jgi:hypothetical protein